MMRNSTNITGLFTGTIDQLLEHCSTIEPTPIDQDIEKQIQQHLIELDMTREEFDTMVKDMMIQEELDKMVVEGKVEIIGYDESGDPLYKSVE